MQAITASQALNTVKISYLSHKMELFDVLYRQYFKTYPHETVHLFFRKNRSLWLIPDPPAFFPGRITKPAAENYWVGSVSFGTTSLIHNCSVDLHPGMIGK
jgi:hypothetical protein